MPWPEVVFIGRYPHIVNRLEHSSDFAPYDLALVTYELDDAPDHLSSNTVAVFTDHHEVRGRYPGVPTLCHVRLGRRNRDLGKWSVSFRGTGLDGGRDSLESGAAAVSDDNEVRQFGVLFLLAAIEQSWRSERSNVSSAERRAVRSLSRKISTYLASGMFTGEAADAMRLSTASMRLEMRNPRPDREIIRRALSRIENYSDQFSAGQKADIITAEVSDLIRCFRSPLADRDDPTSATAETEE